jgi:hypothetical protein
MRSDLLCWLGLFSVPYALGMLHAHLSQGGMSVSYIREYGVADWHIPLYTASAIVAGIGAGQLLLRIAGTKFPRMAVVLAGAALLAIIGRTITLH